MIPTLRLKFLFGDTFRHADGARRANKTAEVTANATRAHKMRLA